MHNIWFLRTDKDSLPCHDLTESTPFIHSLHGSCGQEELVSKYKEFIFPSLSVSDHKLTKLVREIKSTLIERNLLDTQQPGKSRCDISIRYWLSIMVIGDIVFARNKLNEVFLCQVSGYISESFFDKYGCFQRPVKIIQKLTKADLHEDIWHRTTGRKTLERNAKPTITALVLQHLKDNGLLAYSSSMNV